MILPPSPATGSNATSYFSTRSSKSFCSRAPCEGAARASFVTCPTCQGSGEIPKGEWPKALERAWVPADQAPLSLLKLGLGPPAAGRPARCSLALHWLQRHPTPPALMVSPGVSSLPAPLATLCLRIHEVTNDLFREARLLSFAGAFQKFTLGNENLTSIPELTKLSCCHLPSGPSPALGQRWHASNPTRWGEGVASGRLAQETFVMHTS